MRLVALLIPLALAAQPRTLLTNDDFARIKATAQAHPWADAVRTSIIAAADAWPSAFTTKYSLKQWALPPEGGQWSLWYVCPTHGVYLTYKGPGHNECPIDNHNYTGWPFDQVIYGREHSDLANAARDNALTYRFTGTKKYAQNTADILTAYAAIYLKYPLKDVNNKVTASAGRVAAQTLDEASWLIPILWSYDMIADSGVLDATQRTNIETQLLRAAASVIQNNNAGASNWQSWHNAAIGGVGYALNDKTLISKAIDGPSGFRFQMQNSVLPDGPWYEGAWGYHFFALEPLCFLAEMAARNGTDLYSVDGMRRLFNAPLFSTLPDLTLPAFNDSNVISVLNEDQWYELAWNRYQDPLFLSVLGQHSRSRNALFWGVDSIDRGSATQLASLVLPTSGNAFLRTRDSDLAIALKFGPHGGYHGHYDKLNFVSYALGGAMALDPGTQSYASPTHDTWDKVTLAHNTVVIDSGSQAEATGQLLAFNQLPSISLVQASAGSAYPAATLQRTMFLAPEYVLDLYDVKSTATADRKFDWIYHNPGAVTLSVATKSSPALGPSAGYQYLSNLQSAATTAAWTASFDMSPPAVAPFGAVYTSPSTVNFKFEYSPDQSVSGASSGRITYDFTAAQGYGLLTANIANPPNTMPASLSMNVYGDGSGHKLLLRINDATDERFIYTIGPMDWTGWRQINVPDLTRGSHYLGNNDGIMDLPVKNVSIEFDSVANGPKKGAFYVDDIVLGFDAGPITVTDFERPKRNLRLSMLADPATTVYTGNGLGPDLRVPVPFVMARRVGKSTRFSTLMEPYSDAPAVQSFQLRPDGMYEITTSNYTDDIQFRANGDFTYYRTSNGDPVRLASTGLAAVSDLVTLPQPASIQIDFVNGGALIDITLNQPLTAPMRVRAPNAQDVHLNGQPAQWSVDDVFVVIAPQ